MEVVDNNTITELNFQKGIGLGNFDGLHIGHMTLINTLINESKSCNLKSMVFTFMSHPENILRKKLITLQITTKKKKIELLKNSQLDYLFFNNFDEVFSRLSPEDFVSKVLISKLKAKLIVVGFDYKFGYKGKGDVELLRELAVKYKFRLIVIPAIKIKDKKVSSSLIREYLNEGKMKKVNNFMGRYFSVSGKVIHGKGLGKKIGYPTANIDFDSELILPKKGVYVTKTYYKGQYYKSMTSVGNNPTFKQRGISIETYILYFDKDIYNKNVEVFFIKWIRNEKKFNKIDDLIGQIDKDLEFTKKYFKEFD